DGGHNGTQEGRRTGSSKREEIQNLSRNNTIRNSCIQFQRWADTLRQLGNAGDIRLLPVGALVHNNLGSYPYRFYNGGNSTERSASEGRRRRTSNRVKAHHKERRASLGRSINRADRVRGERRNDLYSLRYNRAEASGRGPAPERGALSSYS